MYNLVSFAGIFILLAFAWAVSTNRKVINWRVVIWGVGLQLLIGVFIFIIPVGARLFLFLNDVVVKVLDSVAAGTKFLRARDARLTRVLNLRGRGICGRFKLEDFLNSMQMAMNAWKS